MIRICVRPDVDSLTVGTEPDTLAIHFTQNSNEGEERNLITKFANGLLSTHLAAIDIASHNPSIHDVFDIF